MVGWGCPTCGAVVCCVEEGLKLHLHVGHHCMHCVHGCLHCIEIGGVLIRYGRRSFLLLLQFRSCRGGRGAQGREVTLHVGGCTLYLGHAGGLLH